MTHANHVKILWTHAIHAKTLWTHVTHAPTYSRNLFSKLPKTDLEAKFLNLENWSFENASFSK